MTPEERWQELRDWVENMVAIHDRNLKAIEESGDEKYIAGYDLMLWCYRKLLDEVERIEKK